MQVSSNFDTCISFRRNALKFNYHIDGTLPDKLNEKNILVFGSNLSGYHGAGAAFEAKISFGAEMGISQGLTGNAYAIPTKDKSIRYTLSKEEIIPHIENFIDFTFEREDLFFFVTRIGCGLAGYQNKDIAPYFKFCNPKNCSFSEDWKEFLE